LPQYTSHFYLCDKNTIFVRTETKFAIMDKKLKTGILHAVSEYLTKKGFTDFRADMDTMTQPKKIVEKKSGEIYQPDMTASHEKSSYIFEIEMGDSIETNKDRFLQKCFVLQQHAASKNGKLYLIVPVQQFETVLTEINKNNLENIGILQINGG
jgi:hypothetical protein